MCRLDHPDAVWLWGPANAVPMVAADVAAVQLLGACGACGAAFHLFARSKIKEAGKRVL